MPLRTTFLSHETEIWLVVFSFNKSKMFQILKWSVGISTLRIAFVAVQPKRANGLLPWQH